MYKFLFLFVLLFTPGLGNCAKLLVLYTFMACWWFFMFTKVFLLFIL